ncbi:hypothetical protein PIB30_078732 [Stylosanthes scabra]|uniref:Uncharacterized protein n=1 Tax=Stylosanthes scabra TaxID=79078 RepID=A0ABU6ZPI1_9FABA|nr:hypothetical protein [Stylosanthes scabra]
MGSGVIYYEYEKHEKFKDYDMKADAELGTFKIRRYHFDNESFVHPLHSVRFNPDRPYEIPIEALKRYRRKRRKSPREAKKNKEARRMDKRPKKSPTQRRPRAHFVTPKTRTLRARAMGVARPCGNGRFT